MSYRRMEIHCSLWRISSRCRLVNPLKPCMVADVVIDGLRWHCPIRLFGGYNAIYGSFICFKTSAPTFLPHVLFKLYQVSTGPCLSLQIVYKSTYIQEREMVVVCCGEGGVHHNLQFHYISSLLDQLWDALNWKGSE